MRELILKLLGASSTSNAKDVATYNVINELNNVVDTNKTTANTSRTVLDTFMSTGADASGVITKTITLTNTQVLALGSGFTLVNGEVGKKKIVQSIKAIASSGTIFANNTVIGLYGEQSPVNTTNHIGFVQVLNNNTALNDNMFTIGAEAATVLSGNPIRIYTGTGLNFGNPDAGNKEVTFIVKYIETL